ncbi:hypothetical protein BB559_006179 [Furculomyces boomerangus]|uniref:Protein EFR3 n=1 Tax=Furculomyces boomerangus TaxID=61424 RepID=A0A2T9Y494_9FUNG|nr:hypothetical protein BB559_006179 [Furculomyces boomerangus]
MDCFSPCGCVPTDNLMFYSPFRRYYKHATIIEKCFPQDKNAEIKPLSNELSYLTYYTKSKPVKLAKVGKYLYKRMLSNISHAKIRDVQIELQIFEALLGSNSRDIHYFGTYVLACALLVLKTKNTTLKWEAAEMMSLFCQHRGGTTTIISDEMRDSYVEVVEGFSTYLTQNKDPLVDTIKLQSIGLKVVYAVVKCQDTYIGDGRMELNRIIFAILGRMWMDYKNKKLPLISDQGARNTEKYVATSTEKYPETCEYISLKDSKEAIDSICRMNINDVSADVLLAEQNIRNSSWILLHSLVEFSYGSNLRWIILSLFKFMDNEPESWSHPQFGSNVMSFMANQIGSQYQNVVITETLLFLDNFSKDLLNVKPKGNQPVVKREQIKLTLVRILKELLSSPIILAGVSVLEILLKLVSNLVETAENDTSSYIDLTFNPIDQDSDESSNLQNNTPSIAEQLLNTLLRTIGGLTRKQYYSNQASDVISYMSSDIDIEELKVQGFFSQTQLTNSQNTKNPEKGFILKKSSDDFQNKPIYRKTIWLLKAIRETLGSLVYEKSSEIHFAQNSSQIFSWSSIKPCVQLLASTDPQLRLLSGQILTLAVQFSKKLSAGYKKQMELSSGIPKLQVTAELENRIENLNFEDSEKTKMSRKTDAQNISTPDFRSISKAVSNSTNISAITQSILTEPYRGELTSDASFCSAFHAILKLLVHQLSNNTYCNFLISNCFLKEYISHESSYPKISVLHTISSIYFPLIPIVRQIESNLSLNANTTMNGSSVMNESEIFKSDNNQLDTPLTMVDESNIFLHHFCLLQTILGEMLTIVAGDIVEKDSQEYRDLKDYISDVIKKQKRCGSWCSEMELDIYNPMLSWLTNDKPFTATDLVESTWSYETIKMHFTKFISVPYPENLNIEANSNRELVSSLKNIMYSSYPVAIVKPDQEDFTSPEYFCDLNSSFKSQNNQLRDDDTTTVGRKSHSSGKMNVSFKGINDFNDEKPISDTLKPKHGKEYFLQKELELGLNAFELNDYLDPHDFGVGVDELKFALVDGIADVNTVLFGASQETAEIDSDVSSIGSQEENGDSDDDNSYKNQFSRTHEPQSVFDYLKI